MPSFRAKTPRFSLFYYPPFRYIRQYAFSKKPTLRPIFLSFDFVVLHRNRILLVVYGVHLFLYRNPQKHKRNDVGEQFGYQERPPYVLSNAVKQRKDVCRREYKYRKTQHRKNKRFYRISERLHLLSLHRPKGRLFPRLRCRKWLQGRRS